MNFKCRMRQAEDKCLPDQPDGSEDLLRGMVISLY